MPESPASFRRLAALRHIVVAATVAGGCLCLPSARAQETPVNDADAIVRAKAAESVWRQVRHAPVERLLVRFRSDDVDELAGRRLLRGDRAARDASVQLRVNGYRDLKQQVRGGLRDTDATVVIDYEYLPMSAVTVRSPEELMRLLRSPGVEAVYPDERLEHKLTESLPLVHQPGPGGSGQIGTGTTVAVLDSGVDYTRSAFGSCSAPGVPSATCKVAYAADIATADGQLDADGHGSSVAGIVVGVAPGTRIAALDVFDGSTALSSDIIAGINWAIANRSTYNIVAINLSLGGTTKFTSACSSNLTNPYRPAIANARNAGIVTVIAAGNEGYTDGLAMPACTPEAVSVGAVYDSGFGAANWSLCSDAVTAADKVTCFSNTASFLTMFAPGARITAAGVTYGGTSQATPHVAGAVALLKAAFPTDNPTTTLSRLTSAGVTVTDSRPATPISKPRLDLEAIFPPPTNDDFADRIAITGAAGSSTATNLYATKQGGEPSHAGNAGGGSLWWRWTATGPGTMRLTTTGSAIDTLLGVYTGATVDALTTVSANDDASGTQSALAFVATAGTSYAIAVDGKTGAHGSVTLNWELDSDSDGLGDDLETSFGTNPLDVDSDDDGIGDGVEDADRDGVVDAGETDPRLADSDGDGIQDGTELGRATGVADPDGGGSLLGTDTAIFVPDASPSTVTSPRNADTDGDGFSDGVEDANRNGAIDPGESDPSNPASQPSIARQVPLGPWAPVLMLGLIVVVAHRRLAVEARC